MALPGALFVIGRHRRVTDTAETATAQRSQTIQGPVHHCNGMASDKYIDKIINSEFTGVVSMTPRDTQFTCPSDRGGYLFILF
jgi:hypothetical protein